MGAPGYAFLCEEGHLYDWIDEHLYWDEDTYKREEAFVKNGCPCGKAFAQKVAHYGEFTNCMDLEFVGGSLDEDSEEILIPYTGLPLFRKPADPAASYLPLGHGDFFVMKRFPKFDLEQVAKALDWAPDNLVRTS